MKKYLSVFLIFRWEPALDGDIVCFMLPVGAAPTPACITMYSLRAGVSTVALLPTDGLLAMHERVQTMALQRTIFIIELLQRASKMTIFTFLVKLPL